MTQQCCAGPQRRQALSAAPTHPHRRSRRRARGKACRACAPNQGDTGRVHGSGAARVSDRAEREGTHVVGPARCWQRHTTPGAAAQLRGAGWGGQVLMVTRWRRRSRLRDGVPSSRGLGSGSAACHWLLGGWFHSAPCPDKVVHHAPRPLPPEEIVDLGHVERYGGDVSDVLPCSLERHQWRLRIPVPAQENRTGNVNFQLNVNFPPNGGQSRVGLLRRTHAPCSCPRSGCGEASTIKQRIRLVTSNTHPGNS